MTYDVPSETMLSLRDVTDAQWAALSQRRIFFGHQSVGGNIMQGVAEVLAANPHIRLNVVETRDLNTSDQPAFRHAAVGRNDYPIEKFDDFLSLASSAFDGSGGIAMVKLCYVDMHRDTDIAALFAEYQRRVAELRRQNPSVTIVHFTTPLTTIENWKGRLRATLERRATERERNLVRHRYNELMRQTYAGREPLFDVAMLESRLPSGERVGFEMGDQAVPMLAREYTDDGSHLNAAARRYVAEQLLIMLGRLELSSPTAAARGS